MTKTVAVVNANPEERRDLCRVLECGHYLTAAMGALSDLRKRLTEGRFEALILDLDSLPVDNRFIQKIRKEHPELCIIFISSRHFHPELEESMRVHISACLSKPLNEEELLYWLKNLCVAEPRPRASPSAG
jgi:DNA-binding NtrC family response regulator